MVEHATRCNLQVKSDVSLADDLFYSDKYFFTCSLVTMAGL